MPVVLAIGMDDFSLITFDQGFHAMLQVRNETVQRREEDFVVHDEFNPHDRIFHVRTIEQRRDFSHGTSDEQMHGQNGEQDAEQNVEKEDDLIVESAIFVLGSIEMFFEIEFTCEHQGRADQGVERMVVHALILQ